MYNKKFLNSQIGFTLLELILVVSIFTLIVGAVGPSLSGFLEGRTRETAVLDLRQSLRQAQGYSMARYKQSPWGVYFDQAGQRFILFKGTGYAARDASFDQETRFPSSVRYGVLQLQGGGSEVVFTPVRGETTQAGTIELRQGTGLTRLQINSYGRIEITN